MTLNIILMGVAGLVLVALIIVFVRMARAARRTRKNENPVALLGVVLPPERKDAEK